MSQYHGKVLYCELHIEGKDVFTISSKQYPHIHLENESDIKENLIVTDDLTDSQTAYLAKAG
jgi:hypothetical protein